MSGRLSIRACTQRSFGCGILSREGPECLGSQFGKLSEVRRHYTVPKVSPRLDIAKPILRVFVSKQALEMWVVVPAHALRHWEHQRRRPQACGHNYATIHLSAVLVGKYFPQQLHSLLSVDFAHLLFRWFKFTLKPPYSIVYDKLRLAIWDTSFWTFSLKFGHKGP